MPANTTPQPKLRSDNWTLTPIPVLTPMMFLSGVFFPREQLPPLVRTLSAALPLTNAVKLVRPLFMDQWPAQPLRPALVLALTTLGAFWLALALTRRRFRG